ncbi:TPR end-of-group domain-containing protein [Rugamonas apoptosis]|uniref:Tetratricopeptide repeat protein n=1 Tax=Rugamonas apoptosis TaxID=2758570 RepID=A0A7W2FAC5_9BURK|nr:tetratricopeptide repeat protein [Rugamonas apoptosis]MBA5688058.1 tetratricopeptide repeat protein [Rugamonas apoptosis]
MARTSAVAAVAVLVLLAGAGLYYVKSGPATQPAADEAANHPAPPPEAGPVQKDSKTVNELMNLAISHLEQGNLAEAEKDLQAARAHAPQQPLVAYNTAILRVKQHRPDDALRELEASFVAGFSYFDQLDMDNDLDPLRDNPRFVALVAKYRKPAPGK